MRSTDPRLHHIGRTAAEVEVTAHAAIATALVRFPLPWFVAWAHRWLDGTATTEETAAVMEQARAVAFAAMDALNIDLAVAATFAEVAALDALAASPVPFTTYYDRFEETSVS